MFLAKKKAEVPCFVLSFKSFKSEIEYDKRMQIVYINKI